MEEEVEGSNSSSGEWETIETARVAVDCSFVNCRPGVLVSAAKTLRLDSAFLAHAFKPAAEVHSIWGTVSLSTQLQKQLVYNAQTVPVVGTALYIEVGPQTTGHSNKKAAVDSDENLIEFLQSSTIAAAAHHTKSCHQATFIGQATDQIVLNCKQPTPAVPDKLVSTRKLPAQQKTSSSLACKSATIISVRPLC